MGAVGQKYYRQRQPSCVILPRRVDEDDGADGHVPRTCLRDQPPGKAARILSDAGISRSPGSAASAIARTSACGKSIKVATSAVPVGDAKHKRGQWFRSRGLTSVFSLFGIVSVFCSIALNSNYTVGKVEKQTQILERISHARPMAP